MANEKSKAPKSKTTKQAALPKGFVELGGNLAGFFERKEGNAVQGCYRGAFEVRGGKFGPKRVFRIEVTEGETLIKNKDELMEAEQGDVIGLDETGYTKRLASVKEGTEVYVRCVGKQGTDKDSPWIFQLGIAEHAAQA